MKQLEYLVSRENWLTHPIEFKEMLKQANVKVVYFENVPIEMCKRAKGHDCETTPATPPTV